MGAVTCYQATDERGELAAAAVTATTKGTAITLLKTTRATRIAFFSNTADQEVMITRGGNDWWRLGAGAFVAFDFATDGLVYGAGTVFGAYRTGSAPTTGVVQALSLSGVVA